MELGAVRLIILGGPGSGKGTQAARLCSRLEIPWIATGDILRVAISLSNDPALRLQADEPRAPGSKRSSSNRSDSPSTELQLATPANLELKELGFMAKPYVEKGHLVPDELMIEFIRHRLLRPDVKRQGWLLDGYPRTAFQAEELDFLLEEIGQHLDWAIWLEVPETVMRERAVNRSKSPRKNTRRMDDTPEIVENRIQAFRNRTIPIREYYERRNRLIAVNGNQEITAVQLEILKQLESR